MVAGSSRMSNRSSSAACAISSLGACSTPTHWSGGGSCGGAALVRTSPSWVARSPWVASTRRRSTPSWLSEAVPVESVRPVRTTSVRTVAGPGVAAER